MLLIATNWSHVWMVTLLGFCIVLVLLCFLILVLNIFGFIMQKVTPATAKKAAPKAAPAPAKAKVEYAKDADGATMAAIAMALDAANGDEEKAAIAMALHLYYNNVHDIIDTRITMVGQPTAWNNKSYGMNNAGF